MAPAVSGSSAPCVSALGIWEGERPKSGILGRASALDLVSAWPAPPPGRPVTQSLAEPTPPPRTGLPAGPPGERAWPRSPCPAAAVCLGSASGAEPFHTTGTVPRVHQMPRPLPSPRNPMVGPSCVWLLTAARTYTVWQAQDGPAHARGSLSLDGRQSRVRNVLDTAGQWAVGCCRHSPLSLCPVTPRPPTMLSPDCTRPSTLPGGSFCHICSSE